MSDDSCHLTADEWEVHPDDIGDILARHPECVLLDCRTVQEYHTDHIEGATLMPMQELSIRVAELDVFRGRPIIIYCRTGRRSRIVARYLVHRGFECIRSLAGGIEAWHARQEAK